MNDKEKDVEHSLLCQHLRLINERGLPQDEEERLRVEAMPVSPLSLPEKKRRWRPESYFALLSALVLCGLVPTFLVFIQDDAPNVISKGSQVISVFWRREGTIKKLEVHDKAALRSGDQVTVEALSGVNSTVFLGVYGKDGRRLHSNEFFKGSRTELKAGLAEVIPSSFILTGSSEGEYLGVFFCDQSLYSVDSMAIHKLIQASARLNTDQPASEIGSCHVLYRTLRN